MAGPIRNSCGLTIYDFFYTVVFRLADVRPMIYSLFEVFKLQINISKL